jgi:hypothetical protein
MDMLFVLLAVPVMGAFPPGGAVWKPVGGNWSVPVLTADPTTWEHSAVQEPQVSFF